MSNTQKALTELLARNPRIAVAWTDDPREPKILHVRHKSESDPAPLSVPTPLMDLDRDEQPTRPIHTMICPQPILTAAGNPWTDCQNPPISLGCQVAPRHGRWVGTLGGPAHWQQNGLSYWGALTNWHVAGYSRVSADATLHQPDHRKPSIGYMAAFYQPKAQGTNYIDAALIDTRIDKHHQTGHEIIDIGPPQYPWADAKVGDPCDKSGRTTRHTQGRCIAVGASARVGYDGFEALFEDQDIFESEDGPFSGPGDSGSLIVHAFDATPISLLFAGNNEITLANPMRHVAQKLALRPSFP